MLVAKITAEKAQELTGKEFQQNWFFNPIEMNPGYWIVSLVEAQYLKLGDFEVVDLYHPLIL
jgi:uncharacterized membrane protein